MFPSHHIPKTFLIVFLSVIALGLHSQTLTLTFSFKAENNGQPVELTGVKAINLTHGGETSIVYPTGVMTLDLMVRDTILFVGYAMGFPVGIQVSTQQDPSFDLSQNFPNPAGDQSQVSLVVPEPGPVSLTMTDLQGRKLLHREYQLDKGAHSFRLTTGAGSLCFLTARWNGLSRSIKILHTEGTGSGVARLDYLGKAPGEAPLRATLKNSDLVEQESGILDTPTENRSYTFQYAYNIPCPGTPSVTYMGKVYNTVQIFSQCWLKENLNVGTMLEICTDQTDNGYLEKYCYSDLEDSCSKYGGLYQWDEMMQYISLQGARGICPPGWHVPTRDEWEVLMGIADSQYGIGDTIFNGSTFSGFDAGTNLKSTFGWAPFNFGQNFGGGTDFLGFTGLAGGFRDFYGCSNYGYVTRQAFWWSSTKQGEDLKWQFDLRNNFTTLIRSAQPKRSGYSVRCMKDPD